jgi:adenylate kinase family enzyme
VRRIAVVGNSGSGKTTLGRSVADILAVPFVELDAIYHQAGWRSLPVEEFRQRVGAIAAGAAWVIDGNYSAVRDLVWARADTVVWFDLPRHTVMRQVLGRTLRRALTRAELWNGNREPLTGLLRRAPEESVVRWAWTQHAKYRQRYTAASTDPAYAHITFIRIGSRADAHHLLATQNPSRLARPRPPLQHRRWRRLLRGEHAPRRLLRVRRQRLAGAAGRGRARLLLHLPPGPLRCRACPLAQNTADSRVLRRRAGPIRRGEAAGPDVAGDPPRRSRDR